MQTNAWILWVYLSNKFNRFWLSVSHLFTWKIYTCLMHAWTLNQRINHNTGCPRHSGEWFLKLCVSMKVDGSRSAREWLPELELCCWSVCHSFWPSVIRSVVCSARQSFSRLSFARIPSFLPPSLFIDTVISCQWLVMIVEVVNRRKTPATSLFPTVRSLPSVKADVTTVSFASCYC